MLRLVLSLKAVALLAIILVLAGLRFRRARAAKLLKSHAEGSWRLSRSTMHALFAGYGRQPSFRGYPLNFRQIFATIHL